MRIFSLAVVLSSVLMLTACGYTHNGRPLVPESVSKMMPDGYYGQNSTKLAPQPPAPPPAPVVVPKAAAAKPVWNKIDHYDARNPALPVVGAPQRLAPQPLKYSDSVTVYPVDADADIYKQIDAIAVNGKMVEQLFFAHGSSKISRADGKKLHKLGKSLVHIARQYKLTVIGHASKRIDNVSDPIKKEMINLKMAQKRADAVRRELHKSGVKPDWILVTSKGDKEPNPNPGNKSQEAADRRVEVYMDDKQ